MKSVKELITIVFATSPHRFGESDCMMSLNINVIKATQFKDCHMILCADGVNPHSEYASEEKTKEYDNYISSFKKNFPKLQVIKSKEHIGLTRNYAQAWDWKKIKTPFVLLMNHDTVFQDNILDLDISAMMKNWPDFVNILIFPRHCDSPMSDGWWRERELSDHPEYKKRNFFQRLSKKNSGWENCKIVFGNQDHACILKKNHFQKLKKLYYKPRVTHFLEDSIQAHLSSLKNGEFKSWQDFGGCYYKKNLAIHIDGQSKAGLEFQQEGDRRGETVWSNGQTSYADLLSFERLSKINPAIKESMKELLEQNTSFHTKKCKEEFDNFFSKANYLVTLNKTSQLFLNNSPANFAGKVGETASLPQQNKDCPIHFVFSPNFLEIHWEQKNEENLLLKLTTLPGKTICWGGHSRSYFILDFKKHSISSSDEIKIEIYDYTTKSPPYKKVASLSLKLSVFNFYQDRVVINNKGHEFDKCRLHVAKNNGAMAKYSEKDNSFEVLYRNIIPCESLIGFFEYESLDQSSSRSVTFECKPNPLLINENPADMLLESFSDFFYSLKRENVREKAQGTQSYWGNQVEEINKLLKNDT